jgi:hypothetical protein
MDTGPFFLAVAVAIQKERCEGKEVEKGTPVLARAADVAGILRIKGCLSKETDMKSGQ